MGWMEKETKLHERVAELREAGKGPSAVAAATESMRTEVLRERSAAIAHASQGPGKPMSYGHGKRDEKKGRR